MGRLAGRARIAVGLMLAAAPSGRLASQQAQETLHLATRSFIVARYATVSSASLYAGYGFGPAGVVVGAVDNPRSGYRELIGGVVSRLAWGGQALTVAVASADAPEGMYLQTYLVPSLSLGSVTMGGTIEWYQPLERGAVDQLDVNPIGVTVWLTEQVGIGGLYTIALAQGGPPSQRAGGVVQVAVPHGVVRLEVLRNVARSRSELRFGLEAGFR